MKLNRFTLRRRRLSRHGLCIRCGDEKSAPGKKICPTCAAVKLAKAAPDAEARRAAREKRLVAQLVLIDVARETVLARLKTICLPKKYTF